MSLEDRKKQGKALARLLWTTLTGSVEEVQALGVDAYEDVRDQVEQRRQKRMLNEGHRVEPDDTEARRK